MAFSPSFLAWNPCRREPAGRGVRPQGPCAPGTGRSFSLATRLPRPCASQAGAGFLGGSGVRASGRENGLLPPGPCGTGLFALRRSLAPQPRKRCEFPAPRHSRRPFPSPSSVRCRRVGPAASASESCPVSVRWVEEVIFIWGWGVRVRFPRFASHLPKGRHSDLCEPAGLMCRPSEKRKKKAYLPPSENKLSG